MPPLGVVCASGGMDSCVSAAIAAETQRLAFLHARYGQLTERKELSCFHALADHFNAVTRLVVDLHALRQIGGSSLTDAAIPLRHGAPEPGQVPTSYVPFRNAHLLSAAASWGEALGATAIVIGAVWDDSSGYPDCRPEFFSAFQRAIALGTRPETELRILTPVIGMSKAEIVRQGLVRRAPFELTWSCYSDEELACGTCESCVLRMRGFAGAGVSDPIRYRARNIE